MQCTTNLMRDIMELFCAGDVNRPTSLLALASVAAACNPASNKYGFNNWLLSRIQASNLGQNTDRIHPQYLDNSCRMW